MPLRDCPFPLYDAIQRALLILSWEELPRDERPPRRLWDDDEGLVRHFERVERERERKWGTGSSGAIEDPVENDAARWMVVE